MALSKLLRFGSRRSPKLRLFCFPFAGGGAAAYRTWQSGLPDAVELCAVQPPGREGHMMDRPFHDLHDLVSDMDDCLTDWLQVPFAFFGHSMGALLSFELSRLLRRRGAPLPVHLFLSAHRSPEQERTLKALHLLPNEDLIAELRAMSGTPAEVLANEQLLSILLPVMRADFGACYRYTYTPEEPLPIPMTVYGGIADKSVACTRLSSWGQHTSQPFCLQLFPGNHFYLLHDRTSFLRAFSTHLTGVLKSLA